MTKPISTPDTRTLSDQLRDAIRADERSQAELARLAEMHPVNLSHWLAGRATLTLDTADRLAGVLGGSLVFPAKNGGRKNPGKKSRSA